METNEEDYDKAGSKFVSPPANLPAIVENLGKRFSMIVKGVEMSWKERGKSYTFTVQVDEGTNKGMTQEIHGGAQPDSIWSSKKYYRALVGKDMPKAKGADGRMHPNPQPGDIAGKVAIGWWEISKDKRDVEEGGKGTIYPKLVDIVAATGAKSSTPV